MYQDQSVSQRGESSVSTFIQADWKPGPQAAAFQECKYMQSSRAASISLLAPRAKLSGGVPWQQSQKLGLQVGV